MKHLISILFFILFQTTFLFSQSDCQIELNSKAQKLLEKGSNKKLDINKRQSILAQAYAADENCLECLFLMGINSYKLATVSQRAYTGSQKNFEKLYDACPNYHADVLYYLGLFAYINKDYEFSYKYFTELQTFFKNETDEAKYPKDWDKKYQDVKEVMPEVEFFATFFQNPVPFNPIVVQNASTTADEYLPMLSPDNSLLFYTREKMFQGVADAYPKKVENFTMSKKTGKGVIFNGGEALPKPFNIGFNYGGMTLSADNKEMYITVCKPILGREEKNCDIYKTQYKKYTNDLSGESFTGWTELENLGPNINTPLGWESQPSLSGDGMTLYFATARENTKGIDIFYSERQKDGSWGKAEPLSDVINTKGNEKAPFIHSDSKTIYFASNGHYGAGGYDLFYSRQNDKGEWSTPKNLGHPINSEVDEHGLIVAANGKYAFYSSNRFSQNKKTLDLVSFELPIAAKPEEVMLLTGNLVDENNQPIENAILEFSNTETGESVNVQVNNTDGNYATMVAIPKNRELVMQVKKPGYAFEAKMIKVPEIEDSEDLLPVQQREETKIEKLEAGKSFAIKDINYKTASADIENGSYPILKAFARYLKENPEISFEIRGHTDNVGDSKSNLALSTERAFNVLSFLQDEGIEGSRMKFKGYGDTMPVADNKTAEGRLKNRRTEFVVF